MTANDSTILVTGGAGYIGSHCVKLLRNKGYRVLVVDDLSTGHQKLLQTDDFIHGSTNDDISLEQAFTKYQISTVMHFAAFAYVGESVTDPEKYYQNNILGTLNLLALMCQHNVKQFIFSSTCAVYGEPQELPLVETHPMNPINPYGFTKRVIEEALKDYSAAYGLRYVSFRYFNAAGADPEGELGECHDPETHLIPLVLQVATGKRQDIKIFGTDYDTPDGTCIRDYIHVNDIAKAHLQGMDYLNNGGESTMFNLGNGSGYSVREVIDTCQSVTGKTIAVEETARRPGDPPVLIAKAEKANKVLGWTPDYPDLKSIVQTAWDWEQQHTQ